MSKSFFDLSAKEKKKIIDQAAKDSNETQRKVMSTIDVKNWRVEFRKNWKDMIDVEFLEYVIDDVTSLLSAVVDEERKKTIEEVKNLIDEYNDMDDTAIQFEIRIRKIAEFAFKLNALQRTKEKAMGIGGEV